MITVSPVSVDAWLVEVASRTTTTHRVRVTAADLKRFPSAKGSVEALLVASFEFLLDRESNTSILPTFDLMLIGQYFPEFERTLPKYMKS